ncbi:predicted protein [Plenodomus lingam JN3]|uniref:Predicted protein n=1 Tax=Leptosphaeria maculans (strain JN3 / isolate v23.1.3 / race Av1-4-5-6-7-8) TaxID=985895 RepID=E5R582_LEPMJ|nr:predicted protein [Plenodomus lingam JN3]CBX92052.1 predicted protein [Plenodomus lingam JN3]
MSTYQDLFIAALSHPPDPNDPQPLSNRKETIYGTTLTFLTVSWMAVFFRLWVRFKVVREPGLDDAFVVGAALCNTVATVCVCLSVEAGLGKHMLYLGFDNIERYLLTFYIENGMYVTETTLIKISLLLQYLRIFKAGYMRWICIVLLGLVSAWGAGFMFIAWFPAFPVRGAWDATVVGTRYGFGFRDVTSFVNTFIAHSTLNMVFDIAIFVAPMVLFGTPNLRLKNALAMAGVFTFGGIVVATSIWRLTGIIQTRAGTSPYLDFTWWSPTMIILTCIEIDLAIICASMPIFWPLVEKSFSAIFVRVDVQIVEERVQDNYGLAYELEHRRTADGSVKSSGTSIHRLTDEGHGPGNTSKDYTVGFDPCNEESRAQGFTTEVRSQPKMNWEI